MTSDHHDVVSLPFGYALRPVAPLNGSASMMIAGTILIAIGQ